jgi:hypothetical protein
MRDKQAVPQEAVHEIDEHVQVRAGRDPALVPPALQEGAESGAALGGEVPERFGDVPVLDCSGGITLATGR